LELVALHLLHEEADLLLVLWQAAETNAKAITRRMAANDLIFMATGVAQSWRLVNPWTGNRQKFCMAMSSITVRYGMIRPGTEFAYHG